MTIKQTMSTQIERDPAQIAAIVDEATNGVKAVPAELVIKRTDDSTFDQVNSSNPLPTADAAVLAKLADLESKLDTILNGTTPAAVQVTGSIVADVVYDENTTHRTVNAGATLLLGVYELPKTHRKYSVAIRGVITDVSVEVMWSQSTTFTHDSTGVIFAYERLPLKRRTDTSAPGTAYERWTDICPARARYMQVTVRNTHATDAASIRRSLVTLEPTIGV